MKTVLFCFLAAIYSAQSLNLQNIGGPCASDQDCSLFTPLCVSGLCQNCTSDADCTKVSNIFSQCNKQYGSCFSNVPELGILAPTQISAIIVLFFIHFGIVGLIIAAWVVNSQARGILFSPSTKITASSEEMSQLDQTQ